MSEESQLKWPNSEHNWIVLDGNQLIKCERFHRSCIRNVSTHVFVCIMYTERCTRPVFTMRTEQSRYTRKATVLMYCAHSSGAHFQLMSMINLQNVIRYVTHILIYACICCCEHIDNITDPIIYSNHMQRNKLTFS